MVSTDPTVPPPAYSDSQDHQVSLNVIPDPKGENILISVNPPAVPPGDDDLKSRRAPVDFVLTIDVSGSMGDEANVPGDTG